MQFWNEARHCFRHRTCVTMIKKVKTGRVYVELAHHVSMAAWFGNLPRTLDAANSVGNATAEEVLQFGPNTGSLFCSCGMKHEANRHRQNPSNGSSAGWINARSNYREECTKGTMKRSPA